MNVFLVGGGWSDERARDMFGGFVDAAASRVEGREPRLLLVVLGTDADALESHERYVHALGLVGGHELVIERLAEGQPMGPAVLDEVDGLFIGGGDTPEYHALLAPAYDRIRTLVTEGLPYADSRRVRRSRPRPRSSVAGGSTAPRCVPRTATRTSTPSRWSTGSAWSRARSTCTPRSGATSRAWSPPSTRVSPAPDGVVVNRA